MSGIVGQNLGRGSGLVKVTAVDADSITGASIADDAIDSEHYTNASIDNAHLADDAVGTDEIADNAVTLAKMAGLARGTLIHGDTSGDPAALAVGAADEVLTHDGTDFDWAAAAGGITHTSSWNMHTAFEGPAAPIATNWNETWDSDMHDAAAGLGSSSVTESSGIFSFAVTGIWEVNFHIMISDNSAASKNSQGEIYITTNNATWVRSVRRPAGLAVASMYNSTTMSCFLDVTDVANDKVRFHVSMPADNADVYGLSEYMGTYALFKRLGDT